MRYSVKSTSLPVDQVANAVQTIGKGGNIKVMLAIRQVLCDLEPPYVSELRAKGFIVKPLQNTRAAKIRLPETTIEAAGIVIGETFQPLRDYYLPPIQGEGLTAAVLDSGIRDTHEALLGKVIYKANFSGVGPGDIFDHGTNTASIIIAISPAAKLMDIKVLNNSGVGTEETAIDGIEEVCELVAAAKDQGLPFTHQDYPNVLNISFGSDDDGDYENPLRAACRAAIEDYGLEIICAQGNSGPDLSTVFLPACEPMAIAVGTIKEIAFEVAEYSSRGPTLLGDIKPDFVTWGEGIYVASAKGDDEYLNKSGTSFSAPILVGGRGLLGDLTRRIYGSQYDLSWADIAAVAPLFCTKATDAPLRKDNHWGYGFPMFGRVASQVAARGAPGVSLTEITPILMLTIMMSTLMRGMG